MSRAKLTCVCVALGAMALAGGPAFGGSDRRQQIVKNNSCAMLVKATHPDLKGKAFGAEVAKCKADPEGYNKASGM